MIQASPDSSHHATRKHADFPPVDAAAHWTDRAIDLLRETLRLAAGEGTPRKAVAEALGASVERLEHWVLPDRTAKWPAWRLMQMLGQPGTLPPKAREHLARQVARLAGMDVVHADVLAALACGESQTVDAQVVGLTSALGNLATLVDQAHKHQSEAGAALGPRERAQLIRSASSLQRSLVGLIAGLRAGEDAPQASEPRAARKSKGGRGEKKNGAHA
jgi:hypothetical protein